MRAFVAPLVLCLLAFSAQPSEAAHRRHHVSKHHFGHYLAWRHFHRKPVRLVHHYRYRGGFTHYSGDCARAAALGGPCGCMAMKIVGLYDTKYWLVRNWFVFPRTSPHVGAAAIWRGYSHVEIVAAVNGDGTVTTRGSVGHSHVSQAALIFVAPRRHHAELARFSGVL